MIHPFPAATVVVTSGALIAVASGRLPPAGYFLRVLAAVAMTQIAVGALNDFRDRERDAAGQPWKPIPSGTATAQTALILVTLGIAGTFALAASFGFRSLLLLVLALVGGLAYDLWLKPTPFSLLGYLVGFLGLVTWIWFVSGHLVPVFTVVYPLGAVAVLTAHLAQSWPDIESDRARGQRGLAATLGVRATQIVMRAGLAAMMAGSFALAAVAGSAPAIAVAAAGAVVGGYPLLASSQSEPEPAQRRALFRPVAISIGLLAIGTLLALTTLFR